MVLFILNRQILRLISITPAVVVKMAETDRIFRKRWLYMVMNLISKRELSHNGSRRSRLSSWCDASYLADLKDLAPVSETEYVPPIPTSSECFTWRTVIRTYYQIANTWIQVMSKTVDLLTKRSSFAPTDPAVLQQRIVLQNYEQRSKSLFRKLSF